MQHPLKDERVQVGATCLIVALGCLLLSRQMNGGVRSTPEQLCHHSSFPELCAVLNMGALSATPREGGNEGGENETHSSSGGGGRHREGQNSGENTNGETETKGMQLSWLLHEEAYRVETTPQDPPPLPPRPLWHLDLSYTPSPCPQLYSFAPWMDWPKEDCRPSRPPPPSQEPRATMPADFTLWEAVRICWPARGERLACMKAVWR